MNAFVQNEPIEIAQLQVPAMNYGQFQRWEEHEQLNYTIQMSIDEFLTKSDDFFAQFREEEIADNSEEGFQELAEWKALDWPTLAEMIDSHKSLLEKLVLYSDLDILNALMKSQSEEKPFYSVNSLDIVSINNTEVILKGICFKVKA